MISNFLLENYLKNFSASGIDFKSKIVSVEICAKENTKFS